MRGGTSSFISVPKSPRLSLNPAILNQESGCSALHSSFEEAVGAWDSGARKDLGAFYTPEPMARVLADFALGASASGEINLCDPACGTGRLLLAACDLLAARMCKSLPEREALQLAAQCLFGVDVDARALEACRISIFQRTGVWLGDSQLLCADALSLDFHTTFPEVFARGGFDAVVANPPYGSAVSKRLPTDAIGLRKRFHELGGTSDKSSYFASLACRIVNSTGRVALVMPRAFLCASAARHLRENPPNGLGMKVIAECDSSSEFAGADVYVCLVGFEPAIPNSAVVQAVTQLPRTFAVTASLAVGEAYDLRELVYDSEDGKGLKLITTGLIEPGRSMWGKAHCRFLRRRLLFPRVDMASISQRRRTQAAQPKMIVAGLSKRIEAYFDAAGEALGSVSTYTIVHSDKNAGQLSRLCVFLNSKQASDRLRDELGHSALSGGNITVTKQFLHRIISEWEMGTVRSEDSVQTDHPIHPIIPSPKKSHL